MRKLRPYRAAQAALILLLGSGVGAACSSDPAERPARRPAGYFDTQGLLDKQVQQLQAQHPGLEKRVSLRGSAPETQTLAQPDWAHELQLFYQADINKPALRGAYQVQTTDSAGLTRRSFRRLPDVDHPVTDMTVLQAGPTVRELRAIVNQQNPLFFSGKQLRLRFGEDGTLSSYEVLGQQKLVGFDTTRYVARGRVLR
ncbi:hypothetical protein [Hymenobacter jeollabukensis]|uniref:Outer membrane lipoprotein carrier protein LolA n=1 Tax=Hymenobacter jeollabukensis TaxID=2025313 RepID=A0A5R8WHI4_9BACT|nr:hypothetical protein [Hymenobacter jeollabukensis]TLM87918.1 hypothetical protein FDY95_25075 [Hymenobacter jeollabukensis]